MKVACTQGEGIFLNEIERPQLNNYGTGAIIKTSGCGLCGSDIVKFRQKLVKDGTVLGHEIVGEIVEINSKTEFKIGDKIVSSHHIPCFNCIYCKNENYSMCEHFKKTNIIPGGFSEYIYLSEEHLKNVAVKIPSNLDDLEASFYEPLGCCVRAVKRANLKESSTVLVVGLGSIGLLMGQALKAFGMKVFGCDLIQDRIDLAINLGFDGAFNSFNLEESKEKILSYTDNFGAGAIFMTSGSDKAIDLSLKAVMDGGKILIFASTPKNFGYANNEIYYRELTVMGSYSPAPVDLKDAMNLLETDKVKVKNLSTIYNFDNIESSFRDTIDNKILKAYVKLN